MTDDYFRNCLDQMIDLRHSLAGLANRLPWQKIEASLAKRWSRQVNAGKKIDDLDLLDQLSAVISGSLTNASHPRLPPLLMEALLYLKYAFNERDEEVIKLWGEKPTLQYLSDNDYLTPIALRPQTAGTLP